MIDKIEKAITTCSHCGETCNNKSIKIDAAFFCCEGCKTVYQLLSKNGLCTYYQLNENPGVNRRVKVRENKFSFLENEKIAEKFILYSDDHQTKAVFYLPQIHCSSCLWLLENLQKINKYVLDSRVHFTKKEVTILFQSKKISLKKIAELLTELGYEPHISLDQFNPKAKNSYNKKIIYRLGVAGFCFSNIMLISFPEYFSLGNLAYKLQIKNIFCYFNLLLALPVFFFSAGEFYKTAWKGLQRRFINIDAPIVLAIFITFGRSVYEIITGTGAGYLDSMTGIVFFMLIGRILQNKTNQTLSFDRDYNSYFPIAVSKLIHNKETATPLPELKIDDIILIHNNEIIPSDGILIRGNAAIDYSFVTGESVPIEKKINEIIYAGGRQTGGNIELLLVKDVSQSYLTSLWNQTSITNESEDTSSFIHRLSKYFTVVLLGIAIATGIYWKLHDPSKIWSSITAVLIVACPCALLLSSLFTNGFILRWFDKKKFYLRSALVLEKMAAINHVVFDKTGTLTQNDRFEISHHGGLLTKEQKTIIASVANQSQHPLSRAVTKYLNTELIEIDAFKEIVGQGCEAWVNDQHVVIGDPKYVFGNRSDNRLGATVAYKIDNVTSGLFILKNHFRSQIDQLIKQLQLKYSISIISGDNDASENRLQQLTNNRAELLFFQTPEDKLHHIQLLQQKGKKVMMVGDGLNDAGALKQSDIGIAITEKSNHFSPACDAIMEAEKLYMLNQFIRLASISKRIIKASFIISIIYNIIGLSFAVTGTLQPVIAAILMPASSISIMLFTKATTEIASRKIIGRKHD